MEREALKLGLEAMTQYLAESPDPSEEAVERLCDAASAARKALAQPAQEQWNAALDHAAARIGEIKGFGRATQDSFAVFIQRLKR